MRRIFGDWYQGDGLWIVGPLAAWIAAYLCWTIVLMVRRKRLMSPYSAARELGWGWKLSFLAVVAWLAVALIWKQLDS